MNRTLIDGEARGRSLVLTEPLSFWGGVDVDTGIIVEAGHPQFGETVAGRILVMPHGRGSSSSSSVLAELLRTGRGPAAVILNEPDSILAIGILVAQALYQVECPLVVTDKVVEANVDYVVSGGEQVMVEKLAGNADTT